MLVALVSGAVTAALLLLVCDVLATTLYHAVAAARGRV